MCLLCSVSSNLIYHTFVLLIFVACVLVAALTAENAAEKTRHESDLAEDRAAAIQKATIGATVLTVAVLFRKLVFKL